VRKNIETTNRNVAVYQLHGKVTLSPRAKRCCTLSALTNKNYWIL